MTQFQKSDIQIFSIEMLNFIEEQKLKKLSDFYTLMEKEQKFPIKNNSFFELSTSNSDNNSTAINLSYVISNSGLPLEIKLVREKNTSYIFLKSVDKIKDFEIMAINNVPINDNFGNFPQSKDIYTLEIPYIIQELKKLNE